MKILSYILAFIVLYLSVKPTLDVLTNHTVSSDSCCSVSKCDPLASLNDVDTSDSKDHHEQEEHRLCNPFLTCCAYLMSEVVTSTIPDPTIVLADKPLFFYKPKTFANITLEFWQPPQRS